MQRSSFVPSSSTLLVVLGVRVSQVSAIPHSIMSGALGLLLVFRTNAAYNRFWEVGSGVRYFWFMGASLLPVLGALLE